MMQVVELIKCTGCLPSPTGVTWAGLDVYRSCSEK